MGIFQRIKFALSVLFDNTAKNLELWKKSVIVSDNGNIQFKGNVSFVVDGDVRISSTRFIVNSEGIYLNCGTDSDGNPIIENINNIVVDQDPEEPKKLGCCGEDQKEV